jgi:hypothetical protein
MPAVSNRNRLINFIAGITGVAAGSQAILNLPVNTRYHKLTFNCQRVNYTGGTALTTTKITGAGNDDCTVTPTVTNGVVTAAAVVAGGTGYVTGDTITIDDATGEGCVLTVTAAAGAVTALAVTSGGTASQCAPETLISSLKLLVNGVNMRDIAVADTLKICMANGYFPRLGELPVFFTQPWRNLNQQNELSSWDLFGQSTFQLQIGIQPSISLPSLTGTMEFDYSRNVRPGPKGEAIPFLQPTAQHSFGMPIVSGRNDITTLPFGFPISRLWLQGSTPDSISQVEVYQDGNKVFEGTLEQLKQTYQENGFYFGQPTWLNQTYATSNTLKGAYNEPDNFDAAYISDPDQRPWKALSCANSLTLRVYSDVAQSLTVVMETLPGSFQG